MKFTNLLKSLILETSRFRMLYDANIEVEGQKDYYQMIGLKKGASQDTINSKISAIRQKLESSADKDSPKFNELKKAIDTLGNEQKRKKYDSTVGKKIPFEVFKAMIFADPDTKVPQGFDKENATPDDMEKIKVGAYTQWMLKNYQEPKLNLSDYDMENPKEVQSAIKEYRRLFIEDLDKLTSDLLKFHRFKGRLQDKDINKYTPETLSVAVEDFKLSKQDKSNKEISMMKDDPYKFPGSIVDFRGPNWTVVKIETPKDANEMAEFKNAACHFGGYYDTSNEYDETNWCTSKVDGSYFAHYIKDGPLYVILPNEATEFGKKTGLPKERYQFHFQSNQFMDRRDRQVDLVGMLNGRLSELKGYFKPQFATNLVKQNSKKVEIKYPGNEAGKFVALYGFEELFNSLPDTIEHLLIENSGKENISFDVPNTIGRFVNLHALLLDNFVKTIPSDVCNCKSLHLLALPNNPKLESLPECLSGLDNLAFINLENSNPNIVIPDRLKSRMEDQSGGYYFLNDI